MENFKKFTKLSKDFGELDDKLIIQHFHHIHTMTYTMDSLNFSILKITQYLSFPIIQEFEMLMQESIKEVINIYKYKFFFFKFYAGLRAGPRGPRASPCGPRAYAGRACAGLRAQYPGPSRIFSAGLRAGPAGQALIATPNFNAYCPNSGIFRKKILHKKACINNVKHDVDRGWVIKN